MFEEVLPGNAKRALAVLGESGILDDAYLAGGTALALRLGHRVSVDLDFFSKKEFEEQEVVKRLLSLPLDFELEKIAWRTILGYVKKTKFSIFFYDYEWLGQPEDFSGIKVAAIEDIASMKLLAISDRGTKRDFIDLYFILALEKLYSLKDVLDLYDRKFKVLRQNRMYIIKALTYFKDADEQKMPRMLKEIRWPEVKKFFESETKFLVKQHP
ncbi:MAG: hypothetical protein A3J46_03470 [Candidatus Yanofskybacteria bacterium RIFCSPHIGHO2_02_FULL_41_11]|uniref:Nucleotidyl transferase AbiEii toxin, Type IV TA system n=1 Tax=Candidatus Yanofskybacteria bacterium RIFCSPHIGHO2_02_FULL_41_11 TaxID=1802675 RepID=A0A1F8F9T4_9BACT|nr:MAG: hypothetical protein A3J46_03470 [Candidatus Yanofskybacteria bacterium RIFCSPHIGHO2_02_FULL_41_11]